MQSAHNMNAVGAAEYVCMCRAVLHSQRRLLHQTQGHAVAAAQQSAACKQTDRQTSTGGSAQQELLCVITHGLVQGLVVLSEKESSHDSCYAVLWCIYLSSGSGDVTASAQQRKQHNRCHGRDALAS
jgi:hypothetical protein